MIDPLELIRQLNEKNPEVLAEINARRLRRSLSHRETKLERMTRREQLRKQEAYSEGAGQCLP